MTTSTTRRKKPTEAQAVAKSMAAMSDENLEAWWGDSEETWAETAYRRSPAGKRQRVKLAGRAARIANKTISKELVRPMEEWDDEELARGRPRNSAGTFTGPIPQYVSRAVHEQAIQRFTDIIQSDMRAIVPEALETVRWAMTCDERDDKGKLLVSASTKLDAAKWVVEHLVGKPTQRMEADVSVRLQGLLANVMVSPSDGGVGPLMLSMAATDTTDAESWEDDDEDEMDS